MIVYSCKCCAESQVLRFDLFFLQVPPKALWMESPLQSRTTFAQKRLTPHVLPGCLKVCANHKVTVLYIFSPLCQCSNDNLLLFFLQISLHPTLLQWSRSSLTKGLFSWGRPTWMSLLWGKDMVINIRIALYSQHLVTACYKPQSLF